MPLACVDVVVLNAHREALLLFRSREPARGQWHFPGGRIMRNERIFAAAHRLAGAEAGVAINKLRMLGVEETFYPTDPIGHGKGTHTVNIICAAELQDGIPRPDGSHRAAAWYHILQGPKWEPPLSGYVTRNVYKALENVEVA